MPFTETRNYIMRVTESLAIYEAQLTGQLPSLGLAERLTRVTVRRRGPTGSQAMLRAASRAQARAA